MRKTLYQFIATIPLALLLCLTFSCKKSLLKQTKIAFVSYRDGNAEIYVMNADGSEQTNLTNNPDDDWGPSWSPFLKNGK